MKIKGCGDLGLARSFIFLLSRGHNMNIIVMLNEIPL